MQISKLFARQQDDEASSISVRFDSTVFPTRADDCSLPEFGNDYSRFSNDLIRTACSALLSLLAMISHYCI
jgi:hypothetical protein